MKVLETIDEIAEEALEMVSGPSRENLKKIPPENAVPAFSDDEEHEEPTEEFFEIEEPTPHYSSTWGNFLKKHYDPVTGNIFGRTSSEWLHVLVFYIAFYITLALTTTIGMSIFLVIITGRDTKWQINVGIMGNSPELVFTPKISHDNQIAYNYNNFTSTKEWVNLIDDFLSDYRKVENAKNVQNCDFQTNIDPRTTVCRVNLDHFGPCTSNNNYGYDGSSPCVFLTLNNVYGWEPIPFIRPQADMPWDLTKAIMKLPKTKRNQIWVNCHSELSSDGGKMDGIEYYPGRGFPAYYFPYLEAPNYRSPLVAVRFVNITPNSTFKIECRVWAENIFFQNGCMFKRGSVSFRISSNGK